MIWVLLADDQALVRAGFRALLDAQDDIVVVGEAADGAEAVRLTVEHRPDVVLMDIRMPVLDAGGAPRLDALTEREREVMALVAAGLSNEEIAARLVVSPATAKTHVSRAMVKLGARDRAQLVVLAYEGQAGVGEEAVDQIGSVLDALEPVLDDRQELVDAADGEVTDAAFEV